MAVVVHCSKATVVVTFIPQIDNKYVRQPWPFIVTWRHRTRYIRFAIGHFLLVVLWNRASICIGFWRNWALSILQYLSRKRIEKGPDLRKWRRAPDGCVTPLTKVVCITVLTGNQPHGGELPAMAGRHSFFRAVGSWSLDCQRWWTRICHG